MIMLSRNYMGCVIETKTIQTEAFGEMWVVSWYPATEASDVTESPLLFDTQEEAINSAKRQIDKGWTGESTRGVVYKDCAIEAKRVETALGSAYVALYQDAPNGPAVVSTVHHETAQDAIEFARVEIDLKGTR